MNKLTEMTLKTLVWERTDSPQEQSGISYHADAALTEGALGSLEAFMEDQDAQSFEVGDLKLTEHYVNNVLVDSTPASSEGLQEFGLSLSSADFEKLKDQYPACFISDEMTPQWASDESQGLYDWVSQTNAAPRILMIGACTDKAIPIDKIKVATELYFDGNEDEMTYFTAKGVDIKGMVVNLTPAQLEAFLGAEQDGVAMRGLVTITDVTHIAKMLAANEAKQMGGASRA